MILGEEITLEKILIKLNYESQKLRVKKTSIGYSACSNPNNVV